MRMKQMMGAALSVAAFGLTSGFAFGDNGEISLDFISRYETGVFDEGATEIVGYDKFSQRLFVTNGNDGTVDVLDFSDPTTPTFLFAIDVSDFGSGANSVAVRDGVIAAAVEADATTRPGSVVFYDATGQLLNAVVVGVLPDMVTFSPDGNTVLVANEGEPREDYLIDPEGSVSIIDVSAGVLNVSQQDIQTADFNAFNNENIHPDVRIFGPGATVAQDLEPEYITVSADSSTAWVALQENNALAVVDISSATVTDIVPLGFKKHFLGDPTLDLHLLEDLPVLGTTAAGQEINLGGFSGLYFDGINPDNGNWMFITHPDRGPNADNQDLDDDGVDERPFPLPDFQARLVFLELDPDSGAIEITDQLFLTRGDGVTPITGLPNILCTQPGLAFTDEEPVDVFGNPLGLDPLGADLEGIVRAEDGTFWLVDEYRPAIWHFDANGVMIDRFVPEGSNCAGDDVFVGTEALPEVYAQRRANRGFEAVAYQDGKIYAFMQSALDNPDVPDDSNSKNSLNIRILEFDTETQTTTGAYLYVQDGDGSDKIGDAVSIGPGEFLVLERDSAVGEQAKKNVYRINIQGATNLTTLSEGLTGPGGVIDGLSAQKLQAFGINPVQKQLYVDLPAVGYTVGDKPEGIALIDRGTIAVINDNDFQLADGLDTETGLVEFQDDPTPVGLGIISFQGNGLDTSDEDGAINIANRPVFGMYQPDAIAAFDSNGQQYIISANEGDAREYDAFVEEADAEDLPLDPIAFPTAELLQSDQVLGELTVTNTLGDVDGDGDFDRLYAFGGRSVSIWNADGEQVWDSGDVLEQITAEAFPDEFNSDNDENNSFDSRSDNKGPEPEGITVATLNGHTYAFIGLERIGGVVVYNITDPQAPEFVQYINTRDFEGNAEEGTAGDLGPEGLIVIPADESPNGADLLVVSYEVSGTLAVFEITDGEDNPADLDNSGSVGVSDLLLLLSQWGDCQPDMTCQADLDNNNAVGVSDLLLLLAAWG